MTIFPASYAVDLLRKERVPFDAGIYDTRTGNIIPLHWGWKNGIHPRGWAKADYNEDFFKRLMNQQRGIGLLSVLSTNKRVFVSIL